MFWVLAGATWTTALLTLIALRYSVPASVRQAVGIVGLALFVVAAWRWWSGAWSAEIDLAFFVMLGGLLCDDLLSKLGERRAAATGQNA